MEDLQMKKTIFALAAVALSISLSLTACASAKKVEFSAKDTSKPGAAGVPYLTLNNGAKMPQFGIGTFNLGSDEVVYNSVLTALREGYRHIDTAHAYRAERGVGRAVKQFCEESGVPRSEIWVTSKVWPTEYGEGVTLPAIDRMLERLQLDYLDLLYIHQPAGDYFGAWKDMEKAVEMEKVRTLGISDFDYNDTMFDDFMAKAGTKPAIIQLECHPYAQRLDMRKKIAEHGMILECWFPLGGSGKGNRSLFSNPLINEIARNHGKTAAQIILRWHTQEGFSVIPGSKNPAHIKENISIFDFALTDDEMKQIRYLNKEEHFVPMREETLPHFLQLDFSDYDNMEK